MRIRYTLLTLLFAFIYCDCFAQSCLPDGITFSNQQQIDDFATNYPGCTEILGYVVIKGGSITSLAGLNNINSIGGDLWITNNTSLSSLAGLENLNSIGGYLSINDNASLSSLTGLESLNSIGEQAAIAFNFSLSSLAGLKNLNSIEGSLWIQNNSTSLTSLAGLENLISIGGDLEIRYSYISSLVGLESLDSVGGYLSIEGNNSLITLAGLQNLISIGGDLRIQFNNSLITLAGLQNLISIGGELFIRNNSLITLAGLESLDSIGGNLLIQGNNSLITLAGLESLDSIGGNLSIQSNFSLSSLAGLQNLISIGGNLSIQSNFSLSSLAGLESLISIGGDLLIESNRSLSVCNEFIICNYLINGGSAIIRINAPGCSSESTVLESCDALSKINYEIFYDQNQNKIRDVQEPIYPGASVRIEPNLGLHFSHSDQSGFFFLNQGAYEIIYDNTSTPVWELTTDSASYHINITNAPSIDTLYFGVYPTREYGAMLSHTTSLPTRCNEFILFDVFTKNLGTTIIDGTLWLETDEAVDDARFIDLPDTTIAPNKYGWHFEKLFPGHTASRQIILKIPGPPDFLPGERLHFISYTDFNDQNGQYQSHVTFYDPEVRCSYDPNDKLVSPGRETNETLFDEDLIYTIRFQNTGNDVAFDIVILDTLDQNLDASTFTILSTSHPHQLYTSLEADRYLTFTFENIFLPDSTADFEGSNGYVSYTIIPVDGLPEKTSIINTASIYFDSNPPIITNTTESIMVSELTTAVHELDGIELSIFPNPTTDRVYIQSTATFEGRLQVTDYTGRQIELRDIQGSEQVDLSSQASGIYFITIQTDKGNVVEKVVKLR